jgi:glyoxylase-like metal-dependent hydrolase (beta-lactamase superfamily II)
MTPLARGLAYLDLEFLGLPRVIATAVFDSRDGVALLDPGPSTTLATLRASLTRAGIGLSDLTALVLTHVHLDHAGACGSLVAENPALRVFVHERGAPHLADPVRLLTSAGRLYGDDMARLWGEVRPVPAGNLVPLAGGERIHVGGRALEVAATPGHASHHVSYFSRDTGIAFVGDTAGVRLTAPGCVLPPTPPPDIDLDQWRASVARIDAWKPATLFLTHFGPYMDPERHLDELVAELTGVAELTRQSLERDETDAAREAWFVKRVHARLRQRMAEADAGAYDVAGRLDLCWKGLARYWRKLRR